MNTKRNSLIATVALSAMLLGACAPAAAPALEPIAPAAPAEVEVEEAVEVVAEEPVTDIMEMDENDYLSVDADAMETAVGANENGLISEAEAAGLAFMREEEKLALDVYLTLYDMWGLNIFTNIAASEQTHTDAVNSLLSLNELPDPAMGNEIGVFQNADLQALYDQLIAAGSVSLVEALKVGIAIEEIDIIDLEEYIAETTDASIILVYENLLFGSENHLRAFVSQYEKQTGETFQPQYMTQEAYDTIISASSGRGNH